MEATQAQHVGLPKGEPAKFVRNGKLETCQCRDCRDLAQSPGDAGEIIQAARDLLSAEDEIEREDGTMSLDLAIDRYDATARLADRPRDDFWSIKPRVVKALKGAYVGAALRQPLEEGDIHFIIGWLENAGLKIVEASPVTSTERHLFENKHDAETMRDELEENGWLDVVMMALVARSVTSTDRSLPAAPTGDIPTGARPAASAPMGHRAGSEADASVTRPDRGGK
jgi:hypothetical protein